MKGNTKMIKIENLSKLYYSKKKNDCHALKNINLLLPDEGLVFVLGKSGSGKSTLLNLIGGLDNITSGKIIVNGNDFNTFSERDFCNYRNTHIGFIFQDYHLLDELTVYENIALSLNLKSEDDREKVKDALIKVDLRGYENRYPSELSGGEQQRVSIARAIIKKPKIILADEPTGNLDSLTSKQIIKILQELSKECLILIVSHNISDANKYADRIIELKNGEIISDKSRNPYFKDKVFIDENKLIYPEGLSLKTEDIDLINDNKDKNLYLFTEKFSPTVITKKQENKIKIENKKILFKHEFKLSSCFLKNKGFAIFVSAFMTAVIMVIMALAQTIISFDGNDIIIEEMSNSDQDYLLLNKVLSDEEKLSLENEYRVKVGENDIESFYSAGYNGKIYPVYSYSILIYNTGTYYGTNNSHFRNKIYLSETFGLLIVDENFMKEKFGDYEFLLKANEEKSYGVYITDYVADSLLINSDKYKDMTYNDLIGDLYINGYNNPNAYVNGIIKTNYKEKFSTLVNNVLNNKITSSALYENDEFQALINDIYGRLGYAFSLNSNFLADLESSELLNFPGHYKLNINNIDFYKSGGPFVKINENLSSGTITLSKDVYNQIFGTNYTNETLNTFVPHKITLSHYEYNDTKNINPLFKTEVEIVKLESIGHTMNVSSDVAELFKKDFIRECALYFDGTDGVLQLLDTATELNYEHQSFTVEGVYTMALAVDIFVPMFRLIAIVISAGVILIFVNFSTKMIKDKMHEIGILKALGTKNGSIGVIFGFQIVLISILTCIMATLGYYIFIGLANDVLVESLTRLASNRVVLDLEFLIFKPKIVMINCIMVFILAIISLILPMVKIKNIKPVKIIKTRD